MNSNQQGKLNFQQFIDSTFEKSSEQVKFKLSLSSINSFKNFNKNLSFELSQLLSQQSQNGDTYFHTLFSHDTIKNSIEGRNKRTQMHWKQKINSKQQQLYRRRQERIQLLQNKQVEQQNMFMTIKLKQHEKYSALIEFMKIFATLKISLPNIRIDYYSAKCFEALIKTPEKQIYKAAKAIENIYNEIMLAPRFDDKLTQDGIDEWILDFMIIPRFLISKQKIIKFANEEQLKNCFKMLVYYGCLGHYSNSANKKLPEKEHTRYIISLAMTKNGRDKVKKICSINHGGHFILRHGKQQYHKLFFKNLDDLTHLDQGLKSNKKYLELQKDIKKSKCDQQKEQFLENFEKPLQLPVLPLFGKKAESMNWYNPNTGNKSQQNLSVSEFLNSQYRYFQRTLNTVSRGVIQNKEREQETNNYPLHYPYRKAHSTPIDLNEISKSEINGKKVRRYGTLDISLLVPPPSVIMENMQECIQSQESFMLIQDKNKPQNQLNKK